MSMTMPVTTAVPFHRKGNTPKQDYIDYMKKLEREGYTSPEYGYNRDWRQQVKRMFNSAGKSMIEPDVRSLRQGLMELKYFKGVASLYVTFTCPSCGETEYVEWLLENIDTEELTNECPSCEGTYELTLSNVDVTRWIKKGDC